MLIRKLALTFSASVALLTAAFAGESVSVGQRGNDIIQRKQDNSPRVVRHGEPVHFDVQDPQNRYLSAPRR
jgi:hypothetical protein